MQMQFRSVCAALVLLAACGDNHHGTTPGPDAPPEPPPAQVCSLAPDAAALSGSWDRRFTVAGFAGPDGHAPTMYDFARDTDGSIVAAGEFHYLGDARVVPLLRLRDGAWQPARTTWELAPPGSGFSSVAIAPDGTLALATYDDFGPRSGEIWLDDGTGLRVIGQFDGLIRRLRWFDGKLWAAGWDQIRLDAGQGDVIQGLAVWDGTTWAPPPGGAIDSFAFELVEDKGALLVGGDFTTIGGVASHGAATFDGTTWRALDFPDAAVYAFARGADDELYAGGAFADLGDGAGGIARWTGTTWTKAAGGVVNRRFPGVVTDLTLHDGSLYVTGCFHTVGGGDDSDGAVVSQDIARFDGTWHALDDSTRGVNSPWVEELACGDEGPDSVWRVSKQAMISTGDQLLLGGSFPGIDGVQSQAIVGYAGDAWKAQGTPGLGLGGSLEHVAVAADTCEVWGSGTLSHAAGVPTTSRVLHLVGDHWQAIRDDIPRDALCSGFDVSPSGDVALGCMEFPLDGDAVGRVYHVVGDALVQLGGDQPLIQTLDYGPDGTLWIGGGGETGFVARYDGAAFVTVSTVFDAPVTQLEAIGANEIVVGGSFLHVGALAASRIARWDGTTWSALGAGLPGLPTALGHFGTTIYASNFDEGNGSYLLGAWDGTKWSELATSASGLTPMPQYNFNAIRAIDGAVIAGGAVEVTTGRGVVVYDQASKKFSALGGGVNAVLVTGLAVSNDAIWAAGAIAEAGNGATAMPTVGIARYQLAPRR